MKLKDFNIWGMSIRSILEHSNVFKLTRALIISFCTFLIFLLLILLVVTEANSIAYMLLVVTSVLCLYLFSSLFTRNKWYNGYKFYRQYRDRDVHLDIIKISYTDLHKILNETIKTKLSTGYNIIDLIRVILRTTPKLSSTFYRELINTEEPEEDEENITLYIYSIVNNENIRAIAEISTEDLGEKMLNSLKDKVSEMADSNI